MINELVKLATHLDKKGLRKEADYLDSIIKKAYYSGGSTERASVGTATRQQTNMDLDTAKRMGKDSKGGILYETTSRSGTIKTFYIDEDGNMNDVTGKTHDAYGVDLQNLPLYYQEI